MSIARSWTDQIAIQVVAVAVVCQEIGATVMSWVQVPLFPRSFLTDCSDSLHPLFDQELYI